MRILVTAGPTREPIDPVRYISNRSSGKMGYAVATVAAESGHTVILVSGPVSLASPQGVELVNVTTADEMLLAVSGRIEWCDALVMCAAVADWRPRRAAASKLKKANTAMTIELEPTVDILSSIRMKKGKRIFVGFAAETDDLIAEAKRKVVQKDLDFIVANDVTRPGSGFEVDTNQATVVGCDGAVEELPLVSKEDLARDIVRRIETIKR